jgi:hypothetical protein
MQKDVKSPEGPIGEPADFSLVLGAPLYQLFRRLHLSGDALELQRKRIIVISPLAWRKSC